MSDALMQKMSRVRAYMLEAGYWRMETPIGETTDTLIKLAQERLHRQIGQWARVAHRRVAERAARERMEMTAVMGKFATIKGPSGAVYYISTVQVYGDGK